MFTGAGEKDENRRAVGFSDPTQGRPIFWVRGAGWYNCLILRSVIMKFQTGKIVSIHRTVAAASCSTADKDLSS
jgi:hypothetical protein